MAKRAVDLLLINGWLVSMDRHLTTYSDGAVAIIDDKIEAVGATEDIVNRYTAGTIIDCSNCIISPGLVNAHTHVPMTLLRGLADDLRLDVWLYGYIMPVER